MPIGMTYLLEFWLGSLREPNSMQGVGIPLRQGKDSGPSAGLPRPFDLSKLPAFRRDIQIAELQDLHLVTIVRGIWLILPQMRLLTDPALIEEVLVTRAEKFVRDRFQTRALSNVVNRESLFFAEGADWRWPHAVVA